MKIDRQNYELYAIDFLDGKMDPSEAAAFMAFLAENPDIAQEIELLRDIDTEIVPTGNKKDFSFLMQSINTTQITPDNFEEFCIAYQEGDLDKDAEKRLFEFIAGDEERIQKLELLGRLKIESDERIVYAHKKELKQSVPVPFLTRRTALLVSLAAAASLAMLFILRAPDVKTDQPTMAQDSPVEDIIIPSQENVKVSNKVEQEAVPSLIESMPSNISKEKETLIIETNEEILVAEVPDTNTDDIIRISMIDPKPIDNQIEANELAALKPTTSFNKTFEGKKPTGIQEIKERTTGIFSLASDLTVDNIIKRGVNGLNSMVEGSLSYDAKRNEDGKMTELTLSSDEFNINRKIRNN